MATQEKADQGKQVGGVVKNKAYPSVSLFLGSFNMIFFTWNAHRAGTELGSLLGILFCLQKRS